MTRKKKTAPATMSVAVLGERLREKCKGKHGLMFAVPGKPGHWTFLYEVSNRFAVFKDPGGMSASYDYAELEVLFGL